MKITHKTVLLKGASIDDAGRISGYGAVYGNVDDGGDEILPGAMAKALPGFLKSGFISWNHDWGVPIAMPVAAHEDSKGLWIEAEFHSTDAGQNARTIARERLAAGLTMGLSIGYGDVTSKRLSDRRQLSSIDRLYEVGIVPVPMNREATATSVKSAIKAAADNVTQAAYCLMTINQLIESESTDAAAGDGDATDDATDVAVLVNARDWLLRFIEAESAEVGTEPDLEDVAAEAAAWAQTYGYMGRQSFADHLTSVIAAVKAAAARARTVSRLRKEGRVLSSANRTRLEGLLAALAATQADISDLLASSDPGKGATWGAIDLEYELTRARLAGVPI